MPYVETAWSHASIPADLAGVRPLGDLVLVRMLPEAEMHRNLIWLPQFSGAHGDRQLRPTMPSIGEVVATGPGDKITRCRNCKGRGRAPGISMKAGKVSKTDICAYCDGTGIPNGSWWVYDETGEARKDPTRHPMHVSTGDRIMYWRVPANEVVLNDETFQFLHEEQHVLGVIEDG